MVPNSGTGTRTVEAGGARVVVVDEGGSIGAWLAVRCTLAMSVGSVASKSYGPNDHIGSMITVLA
jgi:hypothetical protein